MIRREAENRAYELGDKYLTRERMLWLKILHPNTWPMYVSKEVRVIIQAEIDRRSNGQ
jgi:hypothetical protein